jgi:streptogramin lyase
MMQRSPRGLILFPGFPVSRRRTLRSVLGGVALLLLAFSASVRAQTPVNFGSVNVGTNTTATVTLLFLNGGTSAGSPAVLTQGAPNLDFLNTTSGTCNTNGSGYHYTAGSTCTVSANFKPARPGLRLGAVEVLDSAGTPLALTYIYGVGLGPQVTYVNNVQGVYQPGSQLAISGYSNPSNVAVDALENVYGIDFTNGYVVEATAASNYQTLTILGGGFSQPQSLMVDGAGNLFIADQALDIVAEIPPGCTSAACVITLPGSYSGASGVAVDGDGNVYIASSLANTISEIETDGTVLTLATFTNADSGIADIALDANNNIFLEVTDQPTITEYFESSHYVTSQSINSGFTGDIFIGGIAVDAIGNIFLPEAYSNTVHEITAANNYASILTLANNLQAPNGIAVDASGNVYVCNAGDNNMIRLDYTDPPALNFETTDVGSTSADSPQTVYFVNDGNENLGFIIPATGVNPTITSPEFTLNSTTSGACPLLTSTSTEQGVLKPGYDCLLPVSFTPLTPGNFTGQLLITDNALNAPAPNYTQQVIELTGKGIIAPTQTTLTSSADAIFLNNSFVLTATVTSGYGTPIGNVTFYDGTTVIGSGNLNSSGVITLNIATPGSPIMTRGIHSLTASYAGNSFFQPSVSSVLSEQIVDFSITAQQPSTQTVLPGKYVTFSITIAPLAPATSMPSEILLTQTGIPTTSTSNLSVVTIPAGSGGATFTVTISAPLGFAQNNSPRNQSAIPPLALALILLPLSLRFQKRWRKSLNRLSIILLLFGSLTAALLIQGCGNYIKPMTYNVQITGTGGALVHSADLTMNFE